MEDYPGKRVTPVLPRGYNLSPTLITSSFSLPLPLPLPILYNPLPSPQLLKELPKGSIEATKTAMPRTRTIPKAQMKGSGCENKEFVFGALFGQYLSTLIAINK